MMPGKFEEADDLVEWMANRYVEMMAVNYAVLVEEYRSILRAAHILHNRTVTQGPDIEPTTQGMPGTDELRKIKEERSKRVWPEAHNIHDDLPRDAVGMSSRADELSLDPTPADEGRLRDGGPFPPRNEYPGFGEALDRSDLQDVKLEDDGAKTTLSVYFREGKTLPLLDRMKIDARVIRDSRSDSIGYPSIWRTSHGWWSQRNASADINGPWNNRRAAHLANDGRYREAHKVNQEQDEGL